MKCKTLGDLLKGKYFIRYGSAVEGVKILETMDDFISHVNEVGLPESEECDDCIFYFSSLDKILDFALYKMIFLYNNNDVVNFAIFYEFINKHKPEMLDDGSIEIYNYLKSKSREGMIGVYQDQIKKANDNINKLMKEHDIYKEVKKIDLEEL